MPCDTAENKLDSGSTQSGETSHAPGIDYVSPTQLASGLDGHFALFSSLLLLVATLLYSAIGLFGGPLVSWPFRAWVAATMACTLVVIYVLRGYRGRWRAKPMAVRASIIITVASVSVGLFALLTTGGVSDPQVAVRNDVTCLSQLRTIGQAIELFANDHAERAPDRLDDLIAAEGIESRVLACPAAGSGVPSAPTAPPSGTIASPSSYIYCARGAKYPFAPKAIVAYDAAANHDGKRGVLFGDGHSELVDEGRFTKMTQTPE